MASIAPSAARPAKIAGATNGSGTAITGVSTMVRVQISAAAPTHSITAHAGARRNHGRGVIATGVAAATVSTAGSKSRRP